MSKPDGGSAYPVPGYAANNGHTPPSEVVEGGYGGMTLRDYFAGQALAGICANPGTEWYGAKPEDMADASFIIAGAMLEAREK